MVVWREGLEGRCADLEEELTLRGGEHFVVGTFHDGGRVGVGAKLGHVPLRERGGGICNACRCKRLCSCEVVQGYVGVAVVWYWCRSRVDVLDCLLLCTHFKLFQQLLALRPATRHQKFLHLWWVVEPKGDWMQCGAARTGLQ